jgi:hypothetical protein
MPAVAGPDDPEAGRLVEDDAFDARVELEVAAKTETVGDVVEIALDLRLCGVALAPLPVLLKFFRELIGILQALGVSALAGIAVPEPGAAEPGAFLESANRKPESLQAMNRVNTGEAGAHHNGVEAPSRAFLLCRLILRHFWAKPAKSSCRASIRQFEIVCKGG